MPLYNRVCMSCKYEEDDLLESINANDVVLCPKCNKMAYAKKIVQSAFKIEGQCAKNGWD